MVYNIYFSPSGGVKKCLSLLSPDAEDIDIGKKDYGKGFSFSKEDRVYIALPVFGGRCPETAIKRLSLFKGNGAKAVLIAVYGNRSYEDALIELYDKAKELGFVVFAAISAIAEHSMVRDIAKGRPDNEDVKRLSEFKIKIDERLNGDEELKSIPGNRPYKEVGKFLVPDADSACIRCGLCYSSCPVGAIDELKPNITDSSKCIGCARCIAICPLSARHYGKEMYQAIEKRLKSLASDRKEVEIFL